MGLSKVAKRDKKTRLIEGIQAHFAKTKTLPLKGEDVSVADLITGLQASIDTGKDTDAKRTVYLAAAKKSRAADAAIEPTELKLTDYLESTLSSEDLSAFGITTKDRAEPDVATKAVAIAKSAATRKARGTMGKKQKQKIVGVLTDDVAAAPAPNPPVANPNAKVDPSNAPN